MDLFHLEGERLSCPLITHVPLAKWTLSYAMDAVVRKGRRKPSEAGSVERKMGPPFELRVTSPVIRLVSFDSIARKGGGSPQYGQWYGAAPRYALQRR